MTAEQIERVLVERRTLAATSDRTVHWEDGATYPLLVVDVTSDSHPFWTGAQRVMDTAGRVEKFERRYGKRKALCRPFPSGRCPARTHVVAALSGRPLCPIWSLSPPSVRAVEFPAGWSKLYVGVIDPSRL